MYNHIFWLLGAHFIADYPLQGDFLAQTKGKYWYSLMAHSIIYATVIGLCLMFLGSYAFWKVALIYVSHLIIDYKKATAKNKDKALTDYLYIDQALHIGINSILLFL
jgi:hypothetical protein